MRHPERVEDYLEHIAQAIQQATGYLERFDSLSAFEQSRREQDAVIRQDSNSRPVDPKSTALSAELPARRWLRRPRMV